MMNRILIIALMAFMPFVMSCNGGDKKSEKETASNDVWEVDFFDDFDSFNPDNWQDQRIWVNNETHCYVPNGNYRTREVSNGSLKLRVVKLDQKLECDNLDKHGKKHPDTKYVAGRIASKNKK